MIRRVAALLLACFGLGGCERDKPEPVARAVSDVTLVEIVATAERVAAGDLDGDGGPELVVVDLECLRVVDPSGRERARWTVPGGIQVLHVTDIDGDGRAEILAGWGRTREHLEASARASIHRLVDDTLVEEIVAEPASERPEIVEILPMSGDAPVRVLVGWFESKYMVRIARAERSTEAWLLSPIDTIRMATSLALGDVDGDGSEDLVVGRVYGDAENTDGDAFVRRPDGSRVTIPVTGGVRSLAVVDLDADGRSELLIGDGWNRDYGRVARARLTHAWWEAGRFRSELVEDSRGQYTLWDILAVDLDGDGAREIVTRGSAEVRVLARGESARWQASSVASACHDLVVLELDRPTLLLVCEQGGQIHRR